VAQSSIEVQFEPGVIEIEGRDPIKYEWALQQIKDNYRLVFHFFLGLRHKDVLFTVALVDVGMTVTNDTASTYEVFYTHDFDGHDLILNRINVFAKDAIKNKIVEDLRKALTPK